jgi:hypothetical protein
MPFYILGAFGRVVCLLAIAGVLATADWMDGGSVVFLFFVLWTIYAFVSGIVAVPYNDIVGRSIASQRRSRMLAIRFFGGGLLGLGVAAAAGGLLESMVFPTGYAAILLLGAGMLLVSSVSFVSAGEPEAPPPRPITGGFAGYLRDGIAVLRSDVRFRLFVYAQWLGGAVMMALPFYVLQVIAFGGGAFQVAFLLAAQTAGALLSNALWGWWGDHHGKHSLYQGVALMRAVPPILIMAWVSMAGMWAVPSNWGFAGVFLLLGALGNGTTIAMLGFLMEISPDDRRPAYSGYFNALVAPAALLPIAGAAIVEATSLSGVFAASLAASIVQFLIIRRLGRVRTLP